jgi:hypothetical protein
MEGDQVLDAILNLTHVHGEHGKLHGQALGANAVTLESYARVLEKLADRWPDGEGHLAEVVAIEAGVRTLAKSQEETGGWLSASMTASWGTAAALIGYPAAAGLVGECHRLIAGDWQAAEMSSLAGRLLLRAADILGHVACNPPSPREDLGGDRTAPSSIRSAVELIRRATDLLGDGAALVHESERGWNVFHGRVQGLIDDELRRSAMLAAEGGSLGHHAERGARAEHTAGDAGDGDRRGARRPVPDRG